ncbi:MAG TPA: DUF2203 family protein [Myxococcota bacterium]|nr:DUF2203 family protein [Myxococcota bacterium]
MERRFSLETARALLGDVRARTERAVKEAEALAREREAHPDGTPARTAAEERSAAVIERWAREMEALGAEVKGLWLVDFDSGAGYYCWRWPEVDFSFHGYEEGFDGRVPIQ